MSEQFRIDPYVSGDAVRVSADPDDFGGAERLDQWREFIPKGEAFTARNKETGAAAAVMGYHYEETGARVWALVASDLALDDWKELLRAAHFVISQIHVRPLRAHAMTPAGARVLEFFGFARRRRATEFPALYVRFK